MSKDEHLEGYCLVCKAKRELKEPKAEWAANDTPATRGKCPVCGTAIYRRGYTPAHDHLPRPEKRAEGSSAESKAKRNKKKKGPSKKSVRRSGKLVVVESPAKARTIGRYLGDGYKVMSSVGHVRDLLKSRLSVDVENNFEPEYRVPNEKRKTVKSLAEAAEKAKEIFLATDPDREGEAIAWHVSESAKMDPKRTHRVVFQEITKPAVKAAFEAPREIDMHRVDAQQARRILDRLVGYKLSPLLWRKVKGRLSAGRVQSVALRLIVEREREIDDFVPDEYWSIEAQLSREKTRGEDPRPQFTAKLFKVAGEEPKLGSWGEVEPHISALDGAVWQVVDSRLGTRRRKPAAPFTTSTLQQESSRRIKFGANKTMRIAQQLYEGIDIGKEGRTGLITYMRTDSVMVAEGAQAEAREFIKGKFGPEYVPASPPKYRTKSKSAQEAHEAVRPTSVKHTPKSIKPFLSRDQFRLYKLIWQRFLSSQMAPAVYDTVSVDIVADKPDLETSDRKYLFRAAGSSLRFAGFLALYEETRPLDRPDDEENIVPTDLKKEEILDLLELNPNQHFTQPPVRFSEATLVKELEENGIGRPSTYAAIISTILSRGYVEMDQRRLAPTPIGELVNDLLVEHFPDVMSVDFTARLEDELDEIAKGKAWVPVLSSFYSQFAERLAAADEVIEKVSVTSTPELVGRDCPVCGNELVYRDGRFGRFIGCSNFPSCRHTEQIVHKLGIDCPKDGGDIIERRTRKGRIFYGCSNYPECDWTSWKKPLKAPCQVCGGLLVALKSDMAECTVCGERQAISESNRELSPQDA